MAKGKSKTVAEVDNGNGWPPFIKAATRWKIVFGLIAALGGAVAAMPVIEPYLPAHRQFVRDENGVVVKSITSLSHQFEEAGRVTQISNTKQALAEAKQTRAKWVLEYNRTDASAITKGLAEEQITTIDSTIESLTAQLRTLQRQK